MKIRILGVLCICIFYNGLDAQTVTQNGDVKYQIFFNENQFSLGTSMDGITGNTEILSRTGDVYLSTSSYRTNSLIVKNGTGNVGIGTALPQAKLDVNGNIFTNGKLAIGTNDLLQIGNYSLAVNGDAIFNKVRVKLYTSWPDYVFHKDYQLRPLEDLESFIKTYSHLPEIPPAADAMEKGIDLGDTQTILLKKIEELTLYIIEQNKNARLQQEQIDKMQLQLNELKNLLDK